MALSICGCGKHLRASETTCPFCGVKRTGRLRVSRALLFAGIAATSAASVACYGGPVPPATNPQAPPASDGGGPVP